MNEVQKLQYKIDVLEEKIETTCQIIDEIIDLLLEKHHAAKLETKLRLVNETTDTDSV